MNEGPKNGSYEYEIKGDPFWCESTEAIQTRLVIKSYHFTVQQDVSHSTNNKMSHITRSHILL